MARRVIIVAAVASGVCGYAVCSAAPLEPAAAPSTANPAPVGAPSPEGSTASSPESPPAIPEEPTSPTLPASLPAETVEEPRVSEAREAFHRGTLLAHQGQWIDALEAFERSVSLRPHPVTMYDVAYCERSLAHYTRASKLFSEAIALHDDGRSGRMSERMLAEARKYLAEVEAKLARVRVILVPPGAAIAVNGAPLEKTQRTGIVPVFLEGTRGPGAPEPTGFESFEVLLDPGTQVFVIRSGEGDPTTVTRQIPAGSTIDLVLRVHEARPAIAPRTLGWAYAAYGLGAAGLAAGAGFGIAAFVKRSDLDNECGSPPRCPRSAGPDIDTARSYARIANVGFAVGAFGGALGTYFLLTSSTSKREGRAVAHGSGPTVGTWIGIGSVGATGTF